MWLIKILRIYESLGKFSCVIITSKLFEVISSTLHTSELISSYFKYVLFNIILQNENKDSESRDLRNNPFIIIIVLKRNNHKLCARSRWYKMMKLDLLDIKNVPKLDYWNVKVNLHVPEIIINNFCFIGNADVKGEVI